MKINRKLIYQRMSIYISGGGQLFEATSRLAARYYSAELLILNIY